MIHIACEPTGTGRKAIALLILQVIRVCWPHGPGPLVRLRVHPTAIAMMTRR